MFLFKVPLQIVLGLSTTADTVFYHRLHMFKVIILRIKC